MNTNSGARSRSRHTRVHAGARLADSVRAYGNEGVSVRVWTYAYGVSESQEQAKGGHRTSGMNKEE
eukprot:6194334-Pleurochrysis_carterae.AAC.1